MSFITKIITLSSKLQCILNNYIRILTYPEFQMDFIIQPKYLNGYLLSRTWRKNICSIIAYPAVVTLSSDIVTPDYCHTVESAVQQWVVKLSLLELRKWKQEVGQSLWFWTAHPAIVPSYTNRKWTSVFLQLSIAYIFYVHTFFTWYLKSYGSTQMYDFWPYQNQNNKTCFDNWNGL